MSGRSWLAAAVAYTALTILLTWPVAARVGTHVPFYNDTWIFVWDVHAVRTALLDPARDVYATRDVFWPEGVSLGLHTLAPLYGAIAVPLEPLLGLVATYDVLWLSTFVLSALSLCALATALGASPAAAFVAGALFAFSPFHLAHAPHLNLLTLQFLPLAAWAALRFLATASWTAALALAAAGALNFYACHEYALFAALLAAVLLAHGLVTRGRGSVRLAPLADVVGRGAGALAVAVLLALPGLVPAVAETWIEGGFDEGVDVAFSADVFSWITPSVLHSLWGGYTMKVYQHFPGVLAEWTTYVGLTVAALAVLGVRDRRRRPAGAWLTVAVVFALLALGPSLRVLGQALPVPLPYRLLKLVPGLGALREPARFAAVVTLATSVLAAFGFDRLRAARAGRLAWAALPLALLEFVQVPLATSDARVPPFLLALAGDRGDYAVLDYPEGIARRERLYHQAVHGKRILQGYVARLPRATSAWVETCPLLADPAEWDADHAQGHARLAKALGVRYAIVERAAYCRGGDAQRFDAVVEALLRLPGARVAAGDPGGGVLVRLDGR